MHSSESSPQNHKEQNFQVLPKIRDDALQFQDLDLYHQKSIEADAATHFIYLLLVSIKYTNLDKFRQMP